MPLLVGAALIFLGNGMLGTLLPIRMVSADFAPALAGAVMSSYFLGLICGTFLARRLISGVGHIRAFATFASTLSAATLAHPFLIAAAPWAALRLVEGLCIAGLAMCSESWLNERAGDAMRGRILSLYMIAIYMSQGVGQFLLNLGEVGGTGLFVLASILMSLAVVPVAATRVRAPTLPEATPFRFRRIYAISPLGVVGALASGVILGAFYGMAPYFASQSGLDVAATTQFMGAAIVGGLVLQWPMGRLSDGFDRRAIIVCLTFAIGLAALVVIPAIDWDRIHFISLAAVFGGLIFTLYPVCVAHANDRVDASELVSVATGLLIAYGIGATLGPLAASVLMSVLGPGALFGFIGAMGLMTAVFTLWRMRSRPAPLKEDRDPFRPVPRTTPVAGELDPRSDPADAEPQEA